MDVILDRSSTLLTSSKKMVHFVDHFLFFDSFFAPFSLFLHFYYPHTIKKNYTSYHKK